MSKINPSVPKQARSKADEWLSALYAPVSLTLVPLWVFTAGVCVAAAPGLHLRRSLARRSARILLRILGLRWRVSGMAHLPDGACVVVANHASYLDGLLLTAILPPRFAFVIKKDMSRVPLAGLLLRRLGSLFVENRRSNNREDTRKLLDRARAGEALGFFPEGTFRRQPGLLPFRSGAFATAIRAEIPVVAISLNGTRRALPAKSRYPLPSQLSLVIHPPITPATNNPREERKRLEIRSRELILAALDEPEA